MEPLPQADIIFERLAGGEGLRTICRDEGMPGEAAVRRRVLDDPEFATRYARARHIGLDSIGESIEEIADDLNEDPNSRRVRIDARKWLLSKLRPDKYGDRITNEHTGPGGEPLTVNLHVHGVSPKE